MRLINDNTDQVCYNKLLNRLSKKFFDMVAFDQPHHLKFTRKFYGRFTLYDVLNETDINL